MQPNTDQRPDTAAPDRAPDTGTAEQAITHRVTADAPGYYPARLRYLRARLQRVQAEEREHDALSAMYHAAQHASEGDRHMLATLADRDASNARRLAEGLEREIESLTAEHPEAMLGTDPQAVVSITITHDKIVTRATLFMGCAQYAQQIDIRAPRGGWVCRSKEWERHRQRLGAEVVEFMESIGITGPRRVADMLPRPATPAGAAIVAEAAAALRS